MTLLQSNKNSLANTNINLADCLSYFWNASLAGLLLFILSPIMLGIYIILRSKGLGDPIFRQTRVGRNGNNFTIFKFQTMYDNATINGPFICDRYDDPRIMPIGQFLRRKKLDELPQLFNIMRGEMNFVGPRPEIPHFHEVNSKQIENWSKRLAVKPGITGPAQIHPTVSHDPKQKIILDLAYIEKHSFLIDLQLLVKTGIFWLTNRPL